MGRRDAVQVTIEVIARMRQLEPRLVVSYEPGWETRGNGTSANYEGALVHHTAFVSSLAKPFPAQKTLRDGRPDLSGPLCNEAAPACTVEQPRIHVVSANPANHAGASGGRAMGPLPVTSLFNPRVRGLEIDYAGTVPMLAGQLHVAHLWARANADVVGGGDINRVRAHFETSVTGKWDIGYAVGKSYDMAAFRRDAATATATGGFLMALSDAQQNEIYAWLRGSGPKDTLTTIYDQNIDLPRRVWWEVMVSRGDGDYPVIQELADAKTQAVAAAGQVAGFQAALSAVAADKGVDIDAIKAAVDAAVRESITNIDVTVNTKQAQ